MAWDGPIAIGCLGLILLDIETISSVGEYLYTPVKGQRR